MQISFESHVREAHILDPLKNFELASQTLEHRKDPLTGRSCIMVQGRLDYIKNLIETDSHFLDELVQSTQHTCPFCPGAVATKSPKFTPQLVPEGRIRVGEAIGFPSLFAHEDFNAVIVPTPRHRVSLVDFTPVMLRDGFQVCLQYFSKVKEFSPRSRHCTIAMNFLPPAGSTVAHPHIQALASDIPLQAVTELLDHSKTYFKENGSCYWTDLIETERLLGKRFLGGTGNITWVTAFAPLGLCEVQGVIPGKSSFTSISEQDLTELADGITRVLRFYHETGIRSFNLAMYSGPLDESENSFNVVIRIVARYGYKPRFVSDIWALQYLLNEREVFESPEETCRSLKKYFE